MISAKIVWALILTKGSVKYTELVAANTQKWTCKYMHTTEHVSGQFHQFLEKINIYIYINIKII